MAVIKARRIKDLNKDPNKRYQRAYWDNSTSMIRFTIDGEPLFSTNGSEPWRKLGTINKKAIDWIEINQYYEVIHPERTEEDNKINMLYKNKESTIQRMLNTLNKDLNKDIFSDPDELDREAWRELFKRGVAVEGTWNKKDNRWQELMSINSFKYKKGTIKFRRKKT